MPHLIDAEVLDQVLGGWLHDLADAGRLDGLLTATAVDGKMNGTFRCWMAYLETLH